MSEIIRQRFVRKLGKIEIIQNIVKCDGRFFLVCTMDITGDNSHTKVYLYDIEHDSVANWNCVYFEEHYNEKTAKRRHFIICDKLDIYLIRRRKPNGLQPIEGSQQEAQGN